MSDEIDPAMSRQEFAVAYSGASRRDDHSIDVQTLAPALLAFGRLLREANNEFNGKKAAAKVLVVSDFEHKCFNVNFELVVSYYQQIIGLLGTDGAKSAKEVLEWVGLLGVPPVGGAAVTLLEYLKWRKGRKIENVRRFLDENHQGKVEVKIVGDNNTVVLNSPIFGLSENATALRATRDTFLPLGRDGFDIMELRRGLDVVGKIDETEVADIVSSCSVGIDEAKETDPEVEVSPAWLSVYSPVYDLDAQNWRFKLGKEIIYADISGTNISEQALARGGAMVDDAYQVRIEITTEVDAHGKKKSPSYKILEVLRFVPAQPPSRQSSLFDGES